MKMKSGKRKRARYIKVNAVRCRSCLKVLVSLDNHDFRACSCKRSVFIDGGTVGLGGYGAVRRGWPRGKVEDCLEEVPLYWRVDA